MKKYVISLGGSLLYKDDLQLNLSYISEFCTFIKNLSTEYWFFIVVGGGKLARWFQSQVKGVSAEDLDNIGIKATWLNAEVVRVFLKDIACEKIITDYRKIPEVNKILVGGGWKPGFSTDFCAVYVAKVLGIKRVLNLTKVNGIYINDKIIKEISASELLKKVPKWKPGLNFPIDPKALKLLHNTEIEFVVLNGENLENVKNCLDGKNFIGTVIKGVKS